MNYKINKKNKMAYAIPYLLIGVLPVFLLIIKGVKELHTNKSTIGRIFSINREGMLLFKTLIYSISVASTCVLIGILVAVYIIGPGKELFRKYKWIIFISLPIPACVHALAWLKWNGVINGLGFLNITSRGWIISWFVQSMTLLPIAVLIVTSGIMLINKEQINAAQLLRKDTGFLIKLLPGYLKPQILAAVAIVFLLTINDYAIPSIFSVNVYSLEIFVEYSSSLSLARTIIKSLPLVAIEAIILSLLPGLIVKVFLSGKKGEFADVKMRFPKGVNLIAFIGGLILLVQIIIPLSVITLDKKMWSELGYTIMNTLPDLQTSFGSSTLSIIFGIPIIYLTAQWLNNMKKLKTGLFFILLPTALPAALIGVAFINIFNNQSTTFIYDSVLMPVFVIIARFMSFGVIAVLAELKRIDKNLINAAKILDKKNIRISLTITIPIIASALIISAAMLFLLGVGELGATVMVLPPGLSTITVRLYNYLHYGATEMVLGISFIIIFIIICIVAINQIISKIILSRFPKRLRRNMEQ